MLSSYFYSSWSAPECTRSHHLKPRNWKVPGGGPPDLPSERGTPPLTLSPTQRLRHLTSPSQQVSSFFDILHPHPWNMKISRKSWNCLFSWLCLWQLSSLWLSCMLWDTIITISETMWEWESWKEANQSWNSVFKFLWEPWQVQVAFLNLVDSSRWSCSHWSFHSIWFWANF